MSESSTVRMLIEEYVLPTLPDTNGLGCLDEYARQVAHIRDTVAVEVFEPSSEGYGLAQARGYASDRQGEWRAIREVLWRDALVVLPLEQSAFDRTIRSHFRFEAAFSQVGLDGHFLADLVHLGESCLLRQEGAVVLASHDGDPIYRIMLRARTAS